MPPLSVGVYAACWKATDFPAALRSLVGAVHAEGPERVTSNGLPLQPEAGSAFRIDLDGPGLDPSDQIGVGEGCAAARLLQGAAISAAIAPTPPPTPFPDPLPLPVVDPAYVCTAVLDLVVVLDGSSVAFGEDFSKQQAFIEK